MHQIATQRQPPVRKPGPRREPAAPICADEAYDVQEFCRRVGWGRAAYAAAKRNGLRTAIAGGRAFVRGDWFLEYLERVASGKYPAADTAAT